jgi:multiple RNA-binding domain-containing protein 1
MEVMKGSDANAIPVPPAADARKKQKRDDVVAKGNDEDKQEDVEEEIDDAEWLRRRKAALDSVADGTAAGEVATGQQSVSQGTPTTKIQRSAEEQQVLSTGRLFVRNLSFLTTAADLTTLFASHGEVVEVHLPLAHGTHKPLGTAFIQFKDPEHALKAWKAVDGKTWMGRLVHVLPGRAKHGEEGVVGVEEVAGDGVLKGKVLGKEEKNVKAEVLKKRKEEGSRGLNWATLYMNVS